jgi:hypothetical protein
MWGGIQGKKEMIIRLELLVVVALLAVSCGAHREGTAAREAERMRARLDQTRLPPPPISEETRSLVDCFFLLSDANSDGCVTEAELEAAYSRSLSDLERRYVAPRHETLLAACDADADGCLSRRDMESSRDQLDTCLATFTHAWWLRRLCSRGLESRHARDPARS